MQSHHTCAGSLARATTLGSIDHRDISTDATANELDSELEAEAKLGIHDISIMLIRGP